MVSTKYQIEKKKHQNKRLFIEGGINNEARGLSFSDSNVDQVSSRNRMMEDPYA